MCSDKEKDVLFSIKYLKKGTIVCVFYNISVYLSPKKDGYCRFKQKNYDKKTNRKNSVDALACKLCVWQSASSDGGKGQPTGAI